MSVTQVILMEITCTSASVTPIPRLQLAAISMKVWTLSIRSSSSKTKDIPLTEECLSVSENPTRSKKGFVAVWLRHAPAPLLWIHPIAKNHVLMPKGDSNAIFDSSGIFIVGTCPPMKMD